MATGDSRLSNTARLLAAQELNRRVLEKKAQEKLAKIEEERRQDAEKRFDRQRALLAKQTATQSANVAAFQQKRLEDDIKKQKAKADEIARVALINKQAQADKLKAIARISSGKGTNIELLSGREVNRDASGKITSLSNRESASSIKAKQTIVREIQRREVERTKVTDLERFLQNEQRLARGDITTSELQRQIAERKARGLSKTPQQKRLLQQRVDDDHDAKLRARQGLKPKGKTAATLAQAKAENERSRAKSAQNFGETQNRAFISVQGAGASFQARAKDSSIGQINSQLALLQRKRTQKSGKATHNENVALQIASGNFFSNLSSFDLGNILSGGQGANPRKAQSASQQKSQGAQSIFGANVGKGVTAGDKSRGTFAQNLNTFSPFAIRAQQDIPDPVTGVTDREVQLFRSQIKEDNIGKPLDQQERVPDTSEFFPTGRAPRADDPFNDFTFSNFGGTDTTKLDSEGGNIANPFAVDQSLIKGRGAFFSDTQTQADIDSARKKANKNKLVQKKTDLGALSASLLRKNTARGQEIEAQNATRSPRFSLSNFGQTVQRQQAPAPTQLSLVPQRAQIGGGVTKNDKGQFFSPSGKQLKGRALVIAKQQDTSQRFGLGSTTSLQPQQSKADRKLAEAQFNTAQNKQGRGQGGVNIPSGDFSSLSLGSQGVFQQGRSTSGLVKAGGSFNRTQTFGGEPLDRFQDPTQPRNLNVSLSENLFFGDDATPTPKTKTPKTSKVTKTSNQQAGFTTRQVQGGQIITSNTPSKPRQFGIAPSTPTPPKSTPAGQNVFGGQQIDLTFGFGKPAGQAVRSGVSGAQGVIDSPFGQQGIQAIQGAIANPQGTIDKAKSAGGTFLELAGQTNFFDPVGQASGGLSSIEGIDPKKLQRDSSSFLGF